MASRSPKTEPAAARSPGDSGGDPPSPLAEAAAEALTREELLRRRRRRAQRLAGVYRRLYWALAEEVRARHRQYVWDLGRSPLDPEPSSTGEAAAARRRKCGFAGCKVRAMAMARFCHGHILSDPKQTLYKGCAFVIKSVQTGQITCGRPILKAAMPSLCTVHLQRTQKNIAQAYKKAGLNPSPTGKTSPKFCVLVAECVRQIQAKRRESLRALMHQISPKDGKND